MSQSNWYIYIVECADKSLYTGVAVDVTRRIQEHNGTEAGAKYTRARRPVCLKYQEQADNRSQACKREAAIKKLSRVQKLKLIGSSSNLVKSNETLKPRNTVKPNNTLKA